MPQAASSAATQATTSRAPVGAPTEPLKLSGFTVIRNAVLMGYPVIASITSLLPLVDEMVVGVGQSDDATKELILSINDPKIKIFDSYWDTQKTKGGLILSEKTNEALDRCANDWCFYLQADEVIHEMDLPAIWRSLEAANAKPEVQGLLFRYIHFYGSYSTIATSRQWYRNEVRIVRKSSGILSHNDAQGFRVPVVDSQNSPTRLEKPLVLASGARVFHYGWVKPPMQMGEKSKLLNRWWHGNKRDAEFANFKYSRQYGLRAFTATHPAVMRDLVERQDWQFDSQRSWSDWRIKDLNLMASDAFEKLFGYRIGEYKPYRLKT